MYDFHMKNNDFATWKRFFVRQFYVFATLMSGKQSKTTISRPKCATVLRFCNTDVRKTKQNNDFTTKMCDSSTFLQHWCPENTVKQWFHDQNVRQFYVSAGKHRKTTISKMKTREALAFMTLRKMKTREALTFLTVFKKNDDFVKEWCDLQKWKREKPLRFWRFEKWKREKPLRF